MNRCLESLPRSLDETYERMLRDIPPEAMQEARRLLTLLCFSSEPLTVPEVIDAIAVSVQKPRGFDRKRRVQDVDDLYKICPGLIDVISGRKGNVQIRIAHFSVQEYLKSDRIQQSAATYFHLQPPSAHHEIAEDYLQYLQDHELCNSHLDESTILRKFPLAQVAAHWWVHHFRAACDVTVSLNRLVLHMLHDRKGSLLIAPKLWNHDSWGGDSFFFSLESSEIAHPLYYASLLGLDRIVHHLLDVDPDDRVGKENLINAHGGCFGSALQAASWKGNEKIVQLLLNAGANVNAQGSRFGNALQAASVSDYGNEETVQLLLDAGANVNTQGGYYPYLQKSVPNPFLAKTPHQFSQ